MLESALSQAGVEIVFVFGSMASGRARPDSDLDLFVVGDIGLRKLTKLMSGISERLGREVNPHVMTREELSKKAQKGDHFLSNVLGSKKRFVVGTENELRALGTK